MTENNDSLPTWKVLFVSSVCSLSLSLCSHTCLKDAVFCLFGCLSFHLVDYVSSPHQGASEEKQSQSDSSFITANSLR